MPPITPASPDPTARKEFPLADAERCVKCGLCLPHCPTYRLAEEEAESPRGRLALLQGLATEAIPLTERTRVHLDHCLLCRACERVCPAEVPYGRIMDAGRALYAPSGRGYQQQRRLRRVLLDSPRRLTWLAIVLWLAQRSGLVALLRASRLTALFRIDNRVNLLPPLERPRHWPPQVAAKGEERGRITLFLGCAARHTDAGALRLATAILSHLGYSVDIPKGQGCCGALQAHGGDSAEAAERARRNRDLFAPGTTVVHLATACGVQLAETLGDPSTGDGPRVVELTRFLADSPWRGEVQPLSGPGGGPLRVQGHLPCSARNGLRDTTAIADLAARLPGVEYTDLPGNALCCGAAGSHMLTEPERAALLREPKITAASGELLLTTNPGCALHLAAGLREQGDGPAVAHPVDLLARALGLDEAPGRLSP